MTETWNSFSHQRQDLFGIVDALVSTGLAASNRVAREFLVNNAVSVNGERVVLESLVLSGSNALFGKYLLLKRGKKLFHLLCF